MTPSGRRWPTSHFDGIYLPGEKTGEQAAAGRKLGFISQDFRSLMLEIWKVKYLQMPRFREVIRSIPMEIRLSHFLNDGDSPDIPIPIYVEYLNQIRDLSRQNVGARNVGASVPLVQDRQEQFSCGLKPG